MKKSQPTIRKPPTMCKSKYVEEIILQELRTKNKNSKCPRKDVAPDPSFVGSQYFSLLFHTKAYEIKFWISFKD